MNAHHFWIWFIFLRLPLSVIAAFSRARNNTRHRFLEVFCHPLLYPWISKMPSCYLSKKWTHREVPGRRGTPSSRTCAGKVETKLPREMKKQSHGKIVSVIRTTSSNASLICRIFLNCIFFHKVFAGLSSSKYLYTHTHKKYLVKEQLRQLPWTNGCILSIPNSTTLSAI